MILSLVGMSNIGKSWWAKQLEAAGYKRICCDDLIAEKLKPLLEQDGFNGDIENVASWMGLPYEKQSRHNQVRYLELEDQVVRNILNNFDQDQVVIDTTGSVVHLSLATRELLRQKTHVVYLQAPANLQQQMFKKFIAEPKPVVWGDFYQPLPGQTDQKALAACYPRLLAARSQLYEQLAHVTLPYEFHYKDGVSVVEFLTKIS